MKWEITFIPQLGYNFLIKYKFLQSDNVADLDAKLLTDQLSDRKRRHGEHPPDDQNHQNDNEVNVWYKNNEIGEGH